MSKFTKLTMFFYAMQRLSEKDPTSIDILYGILLMFTVILTLISIICFCIGVRTSVKKERFWLISSGIGCMLLIVILHIVTTSICEKLSIKTQETVSAEQESTRNQAEIYNPVKEENTVSRLFNIGREAQEKSSSSEESDSKSGSD